MSRWSRTSLGHVANEEAADEGSHKHGRMVGCPV
jgi:hypothetical protein